MSGIGASLLFHLKYYDEMEPIYWAEDEALLDGLDDRASIVEMIGEVGEKACEQAEEFLLACAAKVQAYLAPHCNATIRTRSDKRREWWELYLDLWAKDRRKPKGYYCLAGVVLEPLCSGKARLLSSLWVRGGKMAEEKLVQVLRHGGIPEARQLEGQDTGTVIVAMQEFPLDDPEAANDRDALVEKMTSVFGRLTAKDLNKIIAIVDAE